MDELVVECLKQKREGLTYNEMLKTLGISRHQKNEDFKEQLLKLEKSGTIFLTPNNKYIVMPEEYSVDKLVKIGKHKLYFSEALENNKFIYNENLNGALLEDLVVVTLNEKNEYEVVKVLERKHPKIICEVQLIDDVKHIVPYGYSQDMKVRISQKDMKKLVEGDRILINTTLEKYDEYYEADFIEKIGHRDDPGIDNKCIIISNGFDIDFSKEAMEEVAQLPTEVSEEETKGRLDLRSIETFTIDCEDCKDMDDAVSLTQLENGNYLLGVHISHVPHYVTPQMQLYKEMKDRATSVYTAGSVVPMLPHEISNGICSLNPHVDRLTKSCIMMFNNKGELLDYNIVDSVINSKKKMSYSAVNELLENNNLINGYESFKDMLYQMNELSHIFNRKRKKDGYLCFESSELNIKVDEEHQPKDFEVTKQGSAQKIIENFMLAANECVATHLKWLNLPSVYRVHGDPNELRAEEVVRLLKRNGYKIPRNNKYYNNSFFQKLLSEFTDKPEFSALSKLLLRSMSRANYSVDNIGHFGLGLDNYTHFTSPIRRFPDYEVHYLLDNYHSDKVLDFNYDNLEETLKLDCSHSSLKERAADQAEKDYNKALMVKYMSQHKGEYFTGMIMDIHSKGVIVQTTEMIEGIVRPTDIAGGMYIYQKDEHSLQERGTKNKYKIGHQVLLKSIDVSPNQQEIYFTLEKNLTTEKKLEKIRKKN